MEPVVVSWGRSLSGRPFRWQHEFNWLGTRDPAPLLSIPAAIDFLNDFGLDRFREETHELARYARHRIEALTGLPAMTPDSVDWYGSMVAMPLPIPSGWSPPDPGQPDPLQPRLWEKYRIEVPVIAWEGRRLIRVSCHLYNTREQIDLLVEALAQELAAET